MVDVILFHKETGARIACESELGNCEDIEWAVDKLRGVKADVKVLIIEQPFESESLPAKVVGILKNYLSRDAHIYEHETYLVLQLSADKSQAFIWTAPKRGPLKREEVDFTLIRI